MRARVALYRDPNYQAASAAAAPRQQAAMSDTGAVLAGRYLPAHSVCKRMGVPADVLLAGKAADCPFHHPCVPADEEDGDVPEVPLEELLDDLAALGLDEDEEEHGGGGRHGGGGGDAMME